MFNKIGGMLPTNFSFPFFGGSAKKEDEEVSAVAKETLAGDSDATWVSNDAAPSFSAVESTPGDEGRSGSIIATVSSVGNSVFEGVSSGANYAISGVSSGANYAINGVSSGANYAMSGITGLHPMQMMLDSWYPERFAAQLGASNRDNVAAAKKLARQIKKAAPKEPMPPHLTEIKNAISMIKGKILEKEEVFLGEKSVQDWTLLYPHELVNSDPENPLFQCEIDFPRTPYFSIDGSVYSYPKYSELMPILEEKFGDKAGYIALSITQGNFAALLGHRMQEYEEKAKQIVVFGGQDLMEYAVKRVDDAIEIKFGICMQEFSIDFYVDGPLRHAHLQTTIRVPLEVIPTLDELKEKSKEEIMEQLDSAKTTVEYLEPVDTFEEALKSIYPKKLSVEGIQNMLDHQEINEGMIKEIAKNLLLQVQAGEESYEDAFIHALNVVDRFPNIAPQLCAELDRLLF